MPVRWQIAAPMAMQQHGGRIKPPAHVDPDDEPRSNRGAPPMADDPWAAGEPAEQPKAH